MQRGQLISDRWRVIDIVAPRDGHPTMLLFVVDITSQAKLAVKTINPAAGNASAISPRAFQNEAAAWINLGSHRNIVQAHFIKHINGSPFLFLEFVEGGDLLHLIESSWLVGQIGTVTKLAIQVCDALIYSQERGIVAHGDIKPQNCLISQQETLKLSDFGLSKLVWREQAAPSFSGTAPYMAPEQFLSPAIRNFHTDLYQLGVMLFQMTVGELPFTGTNWDEFKAHHLYTRPPTIDYYSTGLNRIILKCLAKRPEQRFESIVQLREELLNLEEQYSGKRLSVAACTQQMPLAAARIGCQLLSIGEVVRAQEVLAEASQARSSKMLDNVPLLGVLFPQSGPSLRAVALNNQAVALQKLGRYDEALDRLKSALSLNKNLASAWINTAEVLLIKEETAEAVRCLDRALDLDATQEYAWFLKFQILNMLGQAEEAMQCFLKSLEHLQFQDNRIDMNQLGRLSEVLWRVRKHSQGTPTTAPITFDSLMHNISSHPAFRLFNEEQRTRAISRLKDLIAAKALEWADDRNRTDIAAAMNGDRSFLNAALNEAMSDSLSFLEKLEQALAQQLAAWDYHFNYVKAAEIRELRRSGPEPSASFEDLVDVVLEHPSLQSLSLEQRDRITHNIHGRIGELIMATVEEHCTEEQIEKMIAQFDQAPGAFGDILNQLEDEAPGLSDTFYERLKIEMKNLITQLDELKDAELPGWLTKGAEVLEVRDVIRQHPSLKHLSTEERANFLDYCDKRISALLFRTVMKYATHDQSKQMLTAIQSRPESLPAAAEEISRAIASQVPGFIDELNRMFTHEIERLSSALKEMISSS